MSQPDPQPEHKVLRLPITIEEAREYYKDACSRHNLEHDFDRTLYEETEQDLPSDADPGL